MSFIKIPVNLEVREDALFDAVIGCDFAYCGEFLIGVQVLEDNRWLKVIMEDPEDEKIPLTRTLTINDLAEAYGRIISSGQTHCADSQFDLNDPDACFAEYLLQYAVYGELVFG